MKRTWFSWFRVGDQRWALVHGNKFPTSKKAYKYLDQRGGYWTLKKSTPCNRLYPKIIPNNLFSAPSKHTHPSEGQVKVTSTQKHAHPSEGQAKVTSTQNIHTLPRDRSKSHPHKTCTSFRGTGQSHIHTKHTHPSEGQAKVTSTQNNR
jgi:hypothetical protein